MLLLLFSCLVFLFSLPARADLTLASFNVRIFSNNSRTDAELEKVVDRFQQFDFIAVQEVWDQEVNRPHPGLNANSRPNLVLGWQHGNR